VAIFRLSQTSLAHPGPLEEVEMIVRARDQVEARRIASSRGSAWEDPQFTLCSVIDPEGIAGVLLVRVRTIG
jgi:hypothetical protein